MANPITWRNVDGLDTSGVSNLMGLANQTMNKGFDTATTTVKDAITQRASDLKVSRDATLNTALANLNKLSTAEFNDNNIVGSIAVDAGINDPASRRAYEEQVNALRKARREEDEAIAKEEQEKKLRPIAVKQAEVNVDYTGSQIKQNNASANNLNASAASTQQQTSARKWEQGQKESQLNFEQNNAGVLGQLSNANPEYFTQDNLDSLTKGMSPADARFLYKNWTALRDASITRGGSQPTAQTALLNAQEQLGTTKDAQAGRAVVDDSFRSGASYEGTASVVALMPNGPAKNAAFSRLNEIQAGNQVGSSDNSKLVQIGNQSNWESEGRAVAAEGLTPTEALARFQQMYPDNAIAATAVMNAYTAARQGVSDATTGLTTQGSKESIAAATKVGAETAATTRSPDEAKADIARMYPAGTPEYNAAMLSYADAVNKGAEATNAVTTSVAANIGATAQETASKLMNDPATQLTLSSITANPNPTKAINDLLKDVPPNQQSVVRAAIEKSIDAQATSLGNERLESDADTIIQAMKVRTNDPIKVYNDYLNGIPNPAVRAKVAKGLLERMNASGDTGAGIAALVADTNKAVESALDSKVNVHKADITNLVAQSMNGKITDEDLKTSIAGLAMGDPALQEKLITEADKVRGQFNTLSTRERQNLERDLAAVNLQHDSKVSSVNDNTADILKSYPVDDAVAPITSANQVQQNLSNRVAKIEETSGEVIIDFDPSRVGEKINDTFNDAGFKKGLSDDLSAFAKQISAAVDMGQISEGDGKRIINTLFNDPSVLNAIHNQIINTVVQPDANGVIEFTTYGYKPGGNIQQVENARPAAVIAVASNVLNKEIQRNANAELMKQTSALQAEKDASIVKLEKKYTAKPQVTKK